MSRLTLAEQIAQFEDTTPMDIDPEDAYGEYGSRQRDAASDTEDVGGVPTDVGREHYLDVGRSHLRKLHDSTDDPKYIGVKTSRSQIFDDDNDDDDDDDEIESAEEGDTSSSVDQLEQSDDDALSYSGKDGMQITTIGDSPGTDRTESGDDESDAVSATSRDAEKQIISRSHSLETVEDTGLADTLRKTREQDRAKGKAIAKQQALWDSLLDARIRIQKASLGANKLPLPDEIGPYVATDTGRKAAYKLLEETLELSESLFRLEEVLLTKNETITLPPRKRRKINDVDDAVEVEYEPQVLNASTALSSTEAAYHSTLVQTLNKWSTKVQAVAPTTLLSATNSSFSRSNKANSIKSAAQLIAETIDEGKAVARTKIRRSGKPLDRIGTKAPTEDELHNDATEAGEVFDDVDFYQQLLRDIIDSRSGKEDSGLIDGDAWSLKPKKSKRKTDSRESKGRRLRYEVHEKIQNFMVPVPVRGAWHEEQIDELFASLLGKGFEGLASEEVARTTHHPLPDEEFAGLLGGGLGGLRVF